MRVAITGSGGLIGGTLAGELTAAGADVVRIVRRAPAGASELRWDPPAGELDPAGLAGVDAVVHLAGAGIGDRRWSAERKRVILDSRTASTALIARAAAGAGSGRPRALLVASAVGFYGDRGAEVLTESAAPGGDFLASVCREWESAASPAAEAGVRVVHLRTGLVLARHGGLLPKMLLPFRAGLGARLGSGGQWWSWITLRDEVRAITWLLDHEVGGPVNLVAPRPVTNAEFTRALGRAVHRPAVLAVPAFAPRLALGREMADALMFTSARVEPRVLTAGGFEFAHPELDGALRGVLAGPGG